MVMGDLDSYIQKKMKLNHQHTPYTKINSKWIRLKYKSWHHKSPRGEHRQEISDIPCSNILRETSPKARDKKERINKWDLIKIKSFCMDKENSIKMKKRTNYIRNIFANDTLEKGLISKIYKEFTQLHSRKKKAQWKKSAKNLNRYLSRKTYKRAQRHM